MAFSFCNPAPALPCGSHCRNDACDLGEDHKSICTNPVYPYISPYEQILNSIDSVVCIQIRAFLHLPRIPVCRKIRLSRPKSSTYDRPITAWLFFALPEEELS